MYNVEQYFNIQCISVQNIANSSVLQIGTSGVIQAQSHTKNSLPFNMTPESEEDQFVVPLPNPT